MAFIYFVELHPRYHPLLRPVFQKIDNGEIVAVASSITFAEVLVLPLSQGNLPLVQQYRDVLLSNINVVPVDNVIAMLAADIRAADLAAKNQQEPTIRVADAIIAATAIASNCDFLITNDRKLRRINAEIKIALLDDYE